MSSYKTLYHLYTRLFFFLMMLRPPRSTRTDTLLPYTTLFRSTAPRSFPAAALCRDCASLLSLTVAPLHKLPPFRRPPWGRRSEEHTSELQSLMRISYAVFCLNKQRSNIIN